MACIHMAQHEEYLHIIITPSQVYNGILAFKVFLAPNSSALYVAITIGPPMEDSGEVRGFSLVYSGNFLVEAEVTEMGRMRFNMGIHPMGMQWYLKNGARDFSRHINSRSSLIN